MTELHDLSEADQAQLMKEITAARCGNALVPGSSLCRTVTGSCLLICALRAVGRSRAVQKTFKPKKVNVGMLGNMCAQYVPSRLRQEQSTPDLPSETSAGCTEGCVARPILIDLKRFAGYTSMSSRASRGTRVGPGRCDCCPSLAPALLHRMLHVFGSGRKIAIALHALPQAWSAAPAAPYTPEESADLVKKVSDALKAEVTW